ncbi:hypothetical protein LWI28_020386 [Acer negundo]|uniref:Pentatricopeptide repeat-containing protein n=1 Tax=Acer negundo TaxID=4023 RepID=A0AAD5IV45_ACENE|nr:hypothetical protein LWI28_020386 [Acer negundo]
MPEHNQVSWNTVNGTLSISEASISEAVYLNMMGVGWSPNKVTYINILVAVLSLSLGQVSQQIHAQVIKYHIAGDTTIENALLACYGKCGEMDECEKIFSRMSDRKDDVSWNSMISGYIHNELLLKAMDLVWFMTQRGQRLDHFTFATVLSACASVATLERGMEVHASALQACLESNVLVGCALVDMVCMPWTQRQSFNVVLTNEARWSAYMGWLLGVEHFSCMVDLLGRASELDKIEDFINKMPIEPNILICRTVLGACGRANGRKIELGRKAADMLFEKEPRHAVNYVLLANMYTSGGKWEDVARARKLMREAEVKKEAGCSWVTMKDGVHVFVVGDKSHPEKDLVYEKIKELNQKMRDDGYVRQISMHYTILIKRIRKNS